MTVPAARLAAEVTVEGADSAATALTTFGNHVDATAARQSGAAAKSRDHDRALREVGTGALVMGGALLAGFGVAAVATGNFDQEMSGVGAVANATAEELGLLRQAALDAGRDTVFSASEAAQAEAELAKAGVSVGDVLGGALRGSLALAAAGQLNLADAATISAQAMNVFGLEGRDVTHIADVLAAGANKSAADVGLLGDALRQGSLVAKQTGLSLEETAGVLALFADNTLIGSDAGTSLKTMLQRLTPQSDEARAAMDELGISAYDAAGNFVGLETFAASLQTGLGDLTAEQRNSALATIFGSDAVRAAAILYESGAAGVREYVTAVNDQGAASRMAGVQMDNLAGDVEALKGSIETALIQGGSTATDTLRGLTQSATGMVNAFAEAPEWLQGTAMGFAGVGGSALVLVGTVGTMLPKIREVKNALTTLGPGAATGLGVLTGALIVGGFALADWAQKKEEARQRAVAFTDAIRADGGVLAASTRELVHNQLVQDGLIDDLGKLTGHLSSGRAAFDVYTDAVSGNVESQQELRRAFFDSGQAGIEFRGVSEETAIAIREEWIRAGGDLRAVFGDYVRENELGADANRGLKIAHEDLLASIPGMVEGVEDGKRAFETEAGAAKDSAAIMREVTAARVAYNDAVALHGRSSAEAETAEQRLNQALREQAEIDSALADVQADVNAELGLTAESAADAVDALDELKSSYDRLLGVHIDAITAEVDYRAGLAELHAEIRGGTGALDANTEIGRENLELITGTTLGARELAEAIATETGNTQLANLVMAGHVTELRKAMEQAGLTQDEIDTLLARLGILDATNAAPTVSVDTTDAQAKLDRLWSTLNQLTREKSFGSLFGGAFEHAAAGGHFGIGTTLTVGEEEAELVKVTPNGIDVLSGPQTRHALSTPGGGRESGDDGDTFNTYVTGVGLDDVAREIEERQRRQSRLNRLGRRRK